jgi:undecaprenyl-diphosphatase
LRIPCGGSAGAAVPRRRAAGDTVGLVGNRGVLSAWLQRRVRTGDALGLSLTVGLIAVILGGWALGEIADSVVDRAGLTAGDTAVTGWLVGHRTSPLTAAMRFATQLGGIWVSTSVVMLASVLLPAHWGRLRTAATAVVVTLGASLAVNAIKVLIARPRPTLSDVIATATGYAFPSGHSAQGVAAYGFVAYLITRRLPDRRWRGVVWALAAVIAALIGFSRLYLGVHWLTDVLGGFLVAGVWLVLVLTTISITTGRRDGRGVPGTAPAPHDPT